MFISCRPKAFSFFKLHSQLRCLFHHVSSSPICRILNEGCWDVNCTFISVTLIHFQAGSFLYSSNSRPRSWGGDINHPGEVHIPLGMCTTSHPPSPPLPAGRGGCTPTPVYKSLCVSLKTTDEGGVRWTPLALGSPEAPGGLPEAFTGALGPPAFPEGYQGG